MRITILCFVEASDPDSNSWSFVTWIIVVGSNLLVLIWISVYSLSTTPTFTNEVGELLSTVDFWATVLLTVVLAVGTQL